MNDTARKLIQRMAKELDLYRQLLRDDCTSTHPLADEARAYLAQPEPEGPTVMEIIELADEIETEGLGQVDLVRRALARWGRLAQPEPEGLTEEEILNLSEEHDVAYTTSGGIMINPYQDVVDIKDYVLSFARALIAADRARCGLTAVKPEINGQT